jgi:predicted nucleic acid-binding protein
MLSGALQRYFMTLPLLGADRAVALHVAAAELYARARRQAVTPRSPHDCLVAATAFSPTCRCSTTTGISSGLP